MILTCTVDGCRRAAGSKASGHRCAEHYAEDLQRRIKAKGENMGQCVNDGCKRRAYLKSGLCRACHKLAKASK